MPHNNLKQHIGKKALFILTINAIMGTGIFFLPALGAFYSGPASMIAWLVMSIVAIFIAMYFAELVSMFPKSGGVYEYTKNAFGEFASFIFGWVAWIVANITIAMLIVGSLKYLLPEAPMPFSIAASLLIIVIFNFVSYRGIELSSSLLIFFGAVTILSLLSLVIPGLFLIEPSNFNPFFVAPLSSLLLTIYIISETFFGWETTTFLAEEVKNARKVIPRTLITATVAISLISMLVVFVSLGSARWDIFSVQEAPLSFLAEKFFGSDIAKIFAVLVFIPLIGTAASWIVTSPRLLYAMSRDRILVPRFSKIHKRYRTPYQAIIFQTVATSLITIIALGDFYLTLSLLVPLVIIMYSAVMLSVVKLRISKPNLKRYYKAPFGMAGPVAIVIFNIFLLYAWLSGIENAFVIFVLDMLLVVFGIPLYILIKLQVDERFTGKFFDRISVIWDKAFPIWYGKSDIKGVVRRLRLKKNSVVLDFGCGSGITTAALANIAEKGTVVGVDISEKQLEHAVKKIRGMRLSNVILIRESNLRMKENSFDALAAVGVLEYIDNPKNTLRKIFRLLKKGGRFSFLSFGSSFGIPAPPHLKDEASIKKMFKGLGVDVHVSRKKKKFAEYWFIWGTKK